MQLALLDKLTHPDPANDAGEEKWRPIAKAPKDGTLVDLWAEYGDGLARHVAEAWWERAIDPPRWVVKPTETDGPHVDALGWMEYASHWKPADNGPNGRQRQLFSSAYPETWPEQLLHDTRRICLENIDGEHMRAILANVERVMRERDLAFS